MRYIETDIQNERGCWRQSQTDRDMFQDKRKSESEREMERAWGRMCMKKRA